MALGEKVKTTLKELFFDVADVLISPLEWGIQFGLEKMLDILGQSIAPKLKPLIDKIEASGEVPPEIQPILDEIKEPSGEAAFGMAQSMLGGVVGGVGGSIMGVILRRFIQYLERGDPRRLLSESTAVIAWWRAIMTREDVDFELASQGYDTTSQERIIAAMRPLLDIGTLNTLLNRGEISDSKYNETLQAQGWMPDDIVYFKRLRWIIPGVSDLVRMAVREVFSPEIVSKYGLMSDFPPDFAEAAKTVGLSDTWAKNYWGAHWDLPSATAGYEMMHRGVITREDLDTLLRTQDVMPYWRDKLVAIAYNPYTRVDVRRMYTVGVLDEEGVLRAYKDIGYDDEKAQKMTDFTVAYVNRIDDPESIEDRQFTKTELLDGYRRGLLNTEEARTGLAQMGYSPAQMDFYIEREDLKRETALHDAYLSRYRTLFVEGIISTGVLYSELEAVGVERAEIDVLLPLWQLDKITRVATPTKAELEKLLGLGIISEERYKQELALKGYSNEYIGWYLAEMAAEKE